MIVELTAGHVIAVPVAGSLTIIAIAGVHTGVDPIARGA